jgi:hypothetical protein
VNCNNCSLYRRQCRLNTKHIPEHLPRSQRQKWIDAWYEKATNQETCDDYREKI